MYEPTVFDRAKRLADAIMFGRINEVTWRGACIECHEFLNEISVIDDDVIVMQCMACGHEYNWRKIEHDLFDANPWSNEVAPLALDAFGHVLPLNDPEWWIGAAQSDGDWLAEPLVPSGRSIALYAPAKAGKSMIVLALVTALATGRPVFGRHSLARAASVLYLDFEMVESDVLERLEAFGFSATDQLGDHLTYVLAPQMPPLDTHEGGQALLKLCSMLDVSLVVIDTFSRAVQGSENDADTVRDFYRFTGSVLKAAGIAVMRSDHSGKNLDLGMRGSSSKNDDVDVVWQLSRTDGGVVIKRTHSRLAWVPDEVILGYSDHDGHVSIEAGLLAVPAGTSEMMRLLDSLSIDPSVSARQAARELRAAGHGGRTEVINSAQRARRDRAVFERFEHSSNTDIHRGKVIPRAVASENGEIAPVQSESLNDLRRSQLEASPRNQSESASSSSDAPAGVTVRNTTSREREIHSNDDDGLY